MNADTPLQVGGASATLRVGTDADRFFGGIELFQAKKAPVPVFTGAWVPCSPEAPLEGEILAGYARAVGLPPSAILVTGRVSNTEDEARAVAETLPGRRSGRPRVLLVPSAFHMRRARELFERAGLAVSDFPVDFRSSYGRDFSLTGLLPTGRRAH